jgi:ribosomal-protein-alanine N-acetyltransferase
MDNNSDLFGSFETTHLKLRCVRTNDAIKISEMMTPSVSRWVASWPLPFTVEMAIERILSIRAAFMEGRALPCAIERRSDGELLGWIAVTRREAVKRRAMLGYWLGEEYHGHGYMREAAPAAVESAFQTLDLDVIEAAAQPENKASFAVLLGCRMVHVGERMIFASARSRDELCQVYEVVRPRPITECSELKRSLSQ